MKENQDLSTHPVRLVVEPNIPQRNATLEQTQLANGLPGTDDRSGNQAQQNQNQIGLNDGTQNSTQNTNEKPLVPSGAASDRLTFTKTAKLPPLPEVFWQQPLETSINQNKLNRTFINKICTTQLAQETQRFLNMHMYDRSNRTSPPK